MISDVVQDPGDLRVRTRPKIAKTATPLRVVDLFCGCGGLTLGAMQAAAAAERSFSVELAVDNNPAALDVYRHNFGFLTKRLCGDSVEKFVRPQLLGKAPSGFEVQALEEMVGSIDVIIAGPPCQGHSNLNNRTRRLDDRNIMYLAPVRMAAVTKPAAVVIENVPGVSHSMQGVTDAARGLLERCGYLVQQLTIDFRRLGVPQARKRHLMVATTFDFDLITRMEYLVGVVREERTVMDCIADLVDFESPSLIDARSRISADNVERIKYLFERGAYDLPNELRPPCHRDKAHSYISMYGRMRPDRPAQTITGGFGSMGQGRFVHPTRRRMITPHEAARIQGFPDYFKFDRAPSVTALREMIGNAVPPALSKFVVTEMLRTGNV